MRCVILKDKARCFKILRKTLFEFVFLAQRFQYKRDYNILLFQNTTNHIFSSFKTVYRAVESVKERSIMEKYLILNICRTARFKIDSYIPKPETFYHLSGEMRLFIITTYFIWETLGFLLYLFTPVSDRDEWFSNLDTEDALDFEEKLDSWLLCI